jgi:pimeloyl-ACP methyl ester carboxylesterase
VHVLVNGVRLFVDVANPGLVLHCHEMKEKPVLLMLHGGPGFDHAPFKEAFSTLRDVAQVIFFDHRGNGRSGGDDPATWNLAQWGDDVKGLCDALGIIKPVVCGLSFGGFVAQSYATRYPKHPGKLILLSTAAKIDFSVVFETFARIGGPEIGALAESYWTKPTLERRSIYRRRCVPFYRHRRARPVEPIHSLVRPEVALHFNGLPNEHGRFDFRQALATVACPVLMIGGEHDPIVPISLAEKTAWSLPSHLVRFERLANCSHDVHSDDPARVFSIIREFIADGGPVGTNG